MDYLKSKGKKKRKPSKFLGTGNQIGNATNAIIGVALLSKTADVLKSI